jgi:Zn-dependent protease
MGVPDGQGIEAGARGADAEARDADPPVLNGKPGFAFGPGFAPGEILALARGEGKRTFNPLYLFFISALFFSFAGAFSSGRQWLLLAVPVLFLHECGHLLAMRLFRYKDTRILFVPFLGALTSGTPQGFSRGKETLISLAGPAFGLLTGLLFLAAYRFLDQDIWLQLASFSFILNGLNLLPIAPLDGGRVVETLVTSRQGALDLGYRALSVALFIAGAIQFRDYALGIMAYFSAILIRSAVAENRALRSIRKSGGLGGEELDLGSVSLILEAIRANYPAAMLPRLRPKAAADLVARIYRKARMAPAGWAATIGLMAAYAACLGAALIFAVGTVYLKRKMGIP